MEDMPCYWVRRINSLKISILSKAINSTPAKLSMAFSTEIEQKNLKLVWRHKRSWIAKMNLRRKTELVESDFRLYYETTVIKIVWYWHENREPRSKSIPLWSVQFCSVQLLSHVRLFAIPWIAACQASLSITNTQSPPKTMSIELVMPSSHLILCHPLLLLPPIPPSSGFFPMSQHLAWGGQSIWVLASASVLPMNTQDWFPSGWTGWISLQSKGLSKVFSNSTVQKHHSSALSFLYSSTLISIHDYWKKHSLD